ncbi:GNAT family N-acetyltransferase [Alkalicoccobacillus porphyridii]|uniref:GNAT family N-acetyltransferase n=1 Tax=Alkalicoccobacillus porphyridii TaxID=2597270 RepID=A0A554A104_9BACI|nr:GNAT family N-acetyltransferase [Alkalicoccobacillus porphyridii]TSB47365.1 GNAT family N-acetyltransferase [Alkalicoccobacillus porphyridii]
MIIEISTVQTDEEIGALAELAIGIWNEHYIGIITKEQVDYMIQQFQSAEAVKKQIYHEGYEYFDLNLRGVPIGYIGVKEEVGKLFLSKLYLLKQYRGQGYASVALIYLEELCRQRGLGAIWLTVNRENTHTIEVYKKKGFELIRTEVKEIGNGFVMDDYIMEKKI